MKGNTDCTQPVNYSLWTESRQNKRYLLSLQWDLLLMQCSPDISCWGGKRERPKSLRSPMEKQDAKLRQKVLPSQHLSQRCATGPWLGWYSSLGTGFWPHLPVLPLTVPNQPAAVCAQEHLLCCFRPGWSEMGMDCQIWPVLGSGDRKSSARQQRHVNGRVICLDWSNVVSSSEPPQQAQLFWLSSTDHLSPVASFDTAEGIHFPRMNFWNEPQKFFTQFSAKSAGFSLPQN